MKEIKLEILNTVHICASGKATVSTTSTIKIALRKASI